MNPLLIDVSKIPPEGLQVDAELDPTVLHLEGDETFTLGGGSLRSRLERGDDESVHVRGQLAARLKMQCGRCLEPFEWSVGQDLELFYLPHVKGAEQEDEDEVELSDRDMVVAYYRDRPARPGGGGARAAPPRPCRCVGSAARTAGACARAAA